MIYLLHPLPPSLAKSFLDIKLVFGMEQLSEVISIQSCIFYTNYSSIHANVCIGNNCVLHTAASVSSGLQATL